MNNLEGNDYVFTHSVIERSSLIEQLKTAGVRISDNTWEGINSQHSFNVYPIIFFNKFTNVIQGRTMPELCFNELSTEDFLVKAGVTQKHGKRSYQGNILKFNFI